MIKNLYTCLAAVALVGVLASMVEAGSFDTSILESAREARRNAISKFEGHIPRKASPTMSDSESVPDLDALSKESAVKPKPNNTFSIYTRDKHALGGGKPTRNDWNRKHRYVPYAPTRIPEEHSKWPTDYMTPEEYIKRLQPRPTYQFTTD